MKTILPLLLVFFALNSCREHPSAWSIHSPDKALQVQLKLDQEQQLHYQVFHLFEGSYTPISDPSSLGLIREDGRFAENLKFISASEHMGLSDRYTLVSGKKLECESLWNELQLRFENLDKQAMEVHIRAYDQGMAFRYHFPGHSEKNVRVVQELTSFNFMEGNFWAHPYDTLTKWNPAYETFYQGPVPVGTHGPWNKNGWAFPFLVESEGMWMMVSEAGMDGSYGASHIEPDCSDGNYRIRFAEPGEAEGYYEHTSHAPLPWTLPWRFLAIGSSPSAVVESNLATDLAPACALEDTAWIRPGRASWSWWYYSDSPQDFLQLVPYVDLAAEMGWEYSLVDANWNRMKNGSLEQLARYAEKKGVKLLLWYNSGGKHNTVEEAPRDLMDTREARRAEFERISKMGIKGIKVDFFQSDKQEIIGQYIGILEDAADFGIVVNFHGCTLPKGWRRTYPNLLTMEAIRGGECYRFDSSFPEKAPAHLTIVPFTRNVVGPCDYTPGGFSDNTYPHLSTYAFELALPVVIESGVMHHMDTPERTLGLPSFAVDFLKKVPVTWDDTRYIAGYPGKDVVIARKKGESWYLGGINGENHAKELTLDLRTLGDAPSRMVIMTDGSSARELTMTELNVVDGQVKVHMEPYGGFVGIW